MKEIALSLINDFHVILSGVVDKLSLIASYKGQLDDIALKHNLELIEWANSAGGLTVWGLFKQN